MGPPPPPATRCSKPVRKFGVAAEKQLLRILRNPNLIDVDPAPPLAKGDQRPATERHLRQALDHGTPASELFRYRKRLTTCQVEHSTWDSTWRPVLEEAKLPDSSKRPRPPGGAPAAGARPATVARPGKRTTTAPRPVPAPPIAYTSPKQLLRDPDSLANVQRTTEAARRRAARRSAHSYRVRSQVVHRLPRPGEDYKAHTTGTRPHTGSHTASTLRRWSHPAPPPVVALDDGEEGEDAEPQVAEASSLGSFLPPPASLHTAGSHWSLLSNAMRSTWSLGGSSAGPQASDWSISDDWKGRPVTPEAEPAEARPSTATGPVAQPFRVQAGSQTERPSTGSTLYPRSERSSPRASRTERVLQEVMGAAYTPPTDWKQVILPPRIPPPTPELPDARSAIWQQLSGELSFERDLKAKRANASLRRGALTEALDQMTVAIDRQQGVEATATQREHIGVERPHTSEATARLAEQRSLYFLVAGDTEAAQADAEKAIALGSGAKGSLGNPKAHYRRATALRIRSSQVVGPQAVAKAEERRHMKFEGLRSVSEALRTQPTDARFRQLYNRLWREVNTEFSADFAPECPVGRKPRMNPPEAGARIKAQTPPPVEKLDRKQDWTVIDLSDLQAAQADLRDALETALAVRASGSVPDAKQLYAASRAFKKCNVPKSTMEAGLAALEQPVDGEGSDDAVRELQPRETAAEWQEIVDVLEGDRGYLMVVFRFYCVEGGATDASASDSMNLSQWMRFCKDLGFGSPKQPGLTTSELPLIFVRANQDKDEAEAPAQKDRTDSTEEMVFIEFVEACIRLAYRWKRDLTHIADRFGQLVEQKIKTHKCFAMMRDDIDDRMESKEMAAVLESHAGELQKIFVHYAAADKTAFDGAQQDTINMVEWQQLMRECGLFDGVSTVRTATAAFVKVNMDDDLYDNEGGEEGDSAEELVYGEFVECVARVAAERCKVQNKLSENYQDNAKFADMVAAFIQSELGPNFQRAKGKKAGKKLKAAKNALSMAGLLKKKMQP